MYFAPMRSQRRGTSTQMRALGYCRSCQSCHGNRVLQNVSMELTRYWRTLRMSLTKNCGVIYPFKWFMSLVRTSLLWSIEIRKVGREFSIVKVIPQKLSLNVPYLCLFPKIQRKHRSRGLFKRHNGPNSPHLCL